MSGDTRPILVGLADPADRAAEFVLAPWPRSSEGSTLLRLVQEAAARRQRRDYTDLDYLRDFRRVNLVRWTDAEDARMRGLGAQRIRNQFAGGVIVAMGREVARAFGLTHTPIAECKRLHERMIGWVPRPAAGNPYYQDPEARVLVGDFLYAMIRRY